MANENIFPQIPSTVWKGVWTLLRKSPMRKLDDGVLSIELQVQPTAARQYVKELSRLGILNVDGMPTELANRWRQDGDDPEIISEILRGAYPEALLQLAPPDDLDRDKIVRWFMTQNLGEGAAKNKASTYMRIASGVSASDIGRQNGATNDQSAASRKTPAKAQRPRSAAMKHNTPTPPPHGQPQPSGRPDLNVNIQIHISADASAEQIDAIFAGMRKYFD